MHELEVHLWMIPPILPERVTMRGDEPRINYVCPQPRAEHVVLMNAVRDGTLPNPSTAKLVAIAEEFPYSSAGKKHSVDPIPEHLTTAFAGAESPSFDVPGSGA